MYLINSATGLPQMPVDAVPVSIPGGVAITAHVAASATNAGTVAVTATETVLTTATPGCTEISFCNRGANPVAIGAPGLTWASRVWELAPGTSTTPGDVLTRTIGANLAWAAICNTGNATAVAIEKVL